MERRGFLKGVFGGITSAGLVIAASKSEIAAFASPLVKYAPVAVDLPTASSQIVSAGEHLYNSAGELVAVVTQLEYSVPAIDVTNASDNFARFVAGAPRIDIRAVGVGAVEWNQRERTMRLRG